MEIMQIPEHKRWYATLWGILLIIIGVLIVGSIGIIGARTVYFYWQIKTQGIEATRLDFSRKFTPAAGLSAESHEVEGLIDTRTLDDPSFGNPNALVQIVMFSNFECPFSKEVSTTVRELALKYKDSVNVIYRDFPLDSIHKNSRIAAEAAHCVAAQGKFWAYFDKLYGASPDLDAESLKKYAMQVGADEDEFSKCIISEETKQEVQTDYEDGVRAHVVGTPTFFINGVRIEGAIPKNIFEQIIQKNLARAPRYY